jgi:dihydropyrimidinase
MQVTGWPAAVISRGEFVYEDGQVMSSAGRGRFLRCERPFARKGARSWEVSG